ncbi:hypothetical protein QUG02_21675 [Bacillus hominis]|uniref:Aspartate phosphatase n=1 Tax=Bacillus hominis TaxID=2817478 RepID=A0ABT7RCL2_9BACI|nr:hypothetical protein [Bacillus hominis]MDM5195570.1 hypothetical protein [Bacillus hominis]MDM5435230.1 hypothetical protein [Bacillus hominis]MDM5440680.1 hypothetical protein [Bacillus hominis]SCM97674.1 Protein of unknown function [Bacillus mycoides]
MKKIIVIAILFLTIASVIFDFKTFAGKDFKKEVAFEIDTIKEIYIN